MIPLWLYERVVVLTRQNISAGKCWKPVSATLNELRQLMFCSLFIFIKQGKDYHSFLVSRKAQVKNVKGLVLKYYIVCGDGLL